MNGSSERRRLDAKSIWKFAKQDADFNTVFKATELFRDYPPDDSMNIEDYFRKHHGRYNLDTARHRILSTAQLYGLITKKPFFKKGTKYENEVCTPVFEEMSRHKIGSRKYNELMTEQILKVKMRAITDTTDDCKDWNILPVIYSFQVLKYLKDDANISKISRDDFISYVMTSSSYDEFAETIGFLKIDQPTDTYLSEKKDISRFIKIIENIGLFEISQDYISINPSFEEYFQDNFISKVNLNEIFRQIEIDERYSDFLYNIQNFRINLVDNPDSLYSEGPEYNMAHSEDEDKKFDVDELELGNIEAIIETSLSMEELDKRLQEISSVVHDRPVEERVKIARTLVRNSAYADLVKKRAGYRCEICGTDGFLQKNGKKYAEAHHTEELSRTRIDDPGKMICVCPTCHRIIHYGTDEELEKRYELKHVS